jgi:hypothetical protein
MTESPEIGTLPTNLDFEKSMMFFHAYVYGPLQGRLRIYGARRIPAGSVAMSSDWEVFASMLVNDLGRKLGAGIDLINYEVKSAKRKGAYEYQYHKFSGREKLLKDAKVGHLFFDYSENLKEVDLRYMHGSELSEYFDLWLSQFPAKPEEYKGERFRRSIPYGVVKKSGKLLMTLKDGEVAFPEIALQDDTARGDPKGAEAELSED